MMMWNPLLKPALACVFLAFLTCSMPTLLHAESARSIDSFQSGGKRIRMETFPSPAGEKSPSIIVLHGSTGVEFASRFIVTLAQQFARQGFTVHLVHYFDRTGTQYADDNAMRLSAQAWLKTVRDAVAYVHTQRPGAAIGLFGYSLGGYLSAAECLGNPQISAAVILAGGLDEKTAPKDRHALPVLILHGSADTRVPLAEGRKLETAVKEAGGAPELHVYPGEGHIMSLPAYADAVLRGTAFFKAHLAAS
ncbi:MAG: dienelactone hydrolase [Verrucomicrobiaceae bacterium]|nr:dienelactone hydrolase [Verrucomicrobiaceae bacterium]MDB6120279.1 dienelactone hydrolase [Verrucomicrobiaceae bacterium]